MANSFGTFSQVSFTKNSLQNIRIRTTSTTKDSLFSRGGSAEELSVDSVDLEPAATSTSLSATTGEGNDETSDASLASPMGPNSTPPGLLRKLFPGFPWHKIPNYLTYARCLAIPALIVHFYASKHVDKNIHSSLIFAIASITDYLDGYLARRWDICSPFGAFLDPVADKLMVSTALILLTGKYGYDVAIPSSIILAREIAVSALREWMASKGKRDSVKVGMQGKVKTAATMLALTIILSVPDSIGLKWNISHMTLGAISWDFTMTIGMLLLFLSSFVTVTSGSVYFRAAAPVLMGKE